MDDSKEKNILNPDETELPSSQVASAPPQTFEIVTLSNQTETEQLVKEYQRLAKYIPTLNYENISEIEDFKVDLSMLQHRIESVIDASKKIQDVNTKNKMKYLEKVYLEISEKIDTMKLLQEQDQGSFELNHQDSSPRSLKEIDIEESPTFKKDPNSKPSLVGEPITMRTYFIKEEKLIQAEDRQVEFKHYRYPFSKECKAIILKTIVSLLNTQGGTIMIGIRDQDLSVVGMTLDSKQKDEIILQFMQMLSVVNPAVNEEVNVEYLPVKFKWGKWASKTWVCRISVKQGQLDRFYYVEDGESITSFVRYQAMCKQLKLKEIINFTYERAKVAREKQPKIPYSTPDPDGVKNCNLEQDAIDNISNLDSQKVYDNKIIFTDVLESSYQKLTDFLHSELSKNDISYQMINQRRHLVLQFEANDETKKVIQLLELHNDKIVYELRHKFGFKKLFLGDEIKSIAVKREFTFIIDHVEVTQKEAFTDDLSIWLKQQGMKHVWLHFKQYIALYLLETPRMENYLKQNKKELEIKYGFHQKVFFGFCKDYIIIKNIKSKTELKKKLTHLLHYITYRALVEKDGTTIHVKCADFYDLLIAFDRIKSAFMEGQFANFTDKGEIKVFLGFDRYIE